MQRSSSLLRPLKSNSFIKETNEQTKIENLPVYAPKNDKKINRNSNAKIRNSRSRKLFIFCILFALIMFDNEVQNKIHKDIQNNEILSSNISNNINENRVDLKSNNLKKSNLEIPVEYHKNNSSNSKKKSNFRRKISEEELERELELELMMNPVLENLDEEDIKEAIENGKINEAIEEAQEIEEILEEIEERRQERRQKGFRGKKI